MSYPTTSATKPHKIEQRRTCCRCGGGGLYTKYHGVCWRCGGSGTDPTPDRVWAVPAAWAPTQIATWEAKLEQQRIARADKTAAKLQAIAQQAISTYPVLATLDNLRINDETAWAETWHVVVDIYWKATRSGSLTDKQLGLLESYVANEDIRQAEKTQRAAAQASIPPAPAGRVEIEGEVISRKFYENGFGGTIKLIVRADAGWKVFVSEPSNVHAEVGCRVRMTCTITPTDDDPTFGFGKRPTGASLIHPEAVLVP